MPSPPQGYFLSSYFLFRSQLNKLRYREWIGFPEIAWWSLDLNPGHLALE